MQVFSPTYTYTLVMKRSLIILAAALLMSSTSAFAQKFGYFNSMEILSLVPEVKAADSDLQQFTKILQKEGETKMQDLQTKAASLEDRKAKGTVAPKQFEEEMAVLESEGAKLQQLEQEMSAKVTTKRESLYKPILDKVNEKIKEVAKENGYTMIFDSSTGVLLHADETLDITKFVKVKLGIVE
jgi:outer membrane protein